MSYPTNWYWLADDGRLFSSASETLVAADDPAYVAWDATYDATPWPVDDAGNQTNASLQAVLTPYDIFCDLTAYSAYARYNHASGGVKITSLSAVPFLTDPTSRNTVNSAYQYAVANPAHITHWKMSDGSFVQLNNTQIATVNNDITDFVQKCFNCESTTLTGIDGGTITTMAQIDSAYAAISNVYP
jgi:hypothetical protein